jgi:peroxiredoxin
MAVEQGRSTPDFTLKSDSGETVTLSSLRGTPVVPYGRGSTDELT